MTSAGGTSTSILPPKLQSGDKVRFVSPASTPDRQKIYARAKILESWGLNVDFGPHAFAKKAYLAGTDDERLADLNDAFRDPDVRAIFATRGGKGSYRIADRLDFDAARRDPKFLVGFSDITILHLSLYRQCGLIGLHGALTDREGVIDVETSAALRQALMSEGDATIHTRREEPTFALTTTGAATGRLIGGNLDMVATAAGWALPDMHQAILLLEAVNLYLGQVDRQLTMLCKAGHLDCIAGVALGQFTGFEMNRDFSIIDLLREHLDRLNIPVLGGLPLGHGNSPRIAAIGAIATIDTVSGTLSFPVTTSRQR